MSTPAAAAPALAPVLEPEEDPPWLGAELPERQVVPDSSPTLLAAMGYPSFIKETEPYAG